MQYMPNMKLPIVLAFIKLAKYRSPGNKNVENLNFTASIVCRCRLHSSPKEVSQLCKYIHG